MYKNIFKNKNENNYLISQLLTLLFCLLEESYINIFLIAPLLSDVSCVDPERFVGGGPTLTTFFLVDEGRDDPNTTTSKPSSARQQKAI